MTKSFDDIVSNYKDPNPEWEVLINGKNYSTNLELLEFTDSVNNPLKFTVKLSGIDSSDNIPEDSEVIVRKAGGELFRGLLKQVEPNNVNNYTFKGTGYAAELEGDIEKQYSSDVSSIVDDIVLNTGLPNGKSFQTNYNFSNSPLNVEDFRAKKKQLEEVNRLMGEYNVEWYTTFNGTNPVFNVTDQVSFTDGGNPVDTLKTYAPNQSARMVKQNANRNKGDFDGVVVRGYGDGDDQVTATAGSTGKGNRVLLYTDKTIISDAQAQKRADNVLASNSVSWQEIEVEPSDPNKIYSVGQELKIEAEEARLNDTYRVVELYYKFFPSEDDFESTLNLSNKPQTFVDEYKQQKEQTESQTDYSQGNRNTINETNKDLADSGNAVKLEFNIPGRFTTDISGKDRTAQVRLDYVVDDYQQAFQASDLTTIDSSTKLVDTTVNDFGDVERVNTEGRGTGEANSTTADFVQTDVTSAGGTSIVEDSTFVSSNVSLTNGSWTSVAQVNIGSTDVQGAHFHFSTRYEPSASPSNQGEVQNTDIRYRVYNIDRDEYYPGSNGIKRLGNSYAVTTGAWLRGNESVSIFVPKDIDNESCEFQVLASPVDLELTYSVHYYSEGKHNHTLPNTPDGADNVSAYTVASDGTDIDAGQGASQGNESLPDTGTTTFGKLDSNDLVLQTKSTAATSLTVRVNGTEISGSPFSLSGSAPYKNADIDISSEITSPGANTVELIPDSKALVKGNVLVDHKMDSERV